MTFKRKILTLLLTSIGCVTLNLAWGAPASTALPFDDISNSSAQKQIIDLYNRKIIQGNGERSFKPNKAITRAEFIAMLDRMLNIRPVPNAIASFNDVPRNTWYYGWVQAGVNLNIIESASSRIFNPLNPITRQEAAAMIIRAMKQKAGDAGKGELAFQDADRISAWAVPYVYSVNELGWMKGGKGSFRPIDPITREETAVVLSRILQNSAWDKQIHSDPKPTLQLGWQYNLTTKQYIERIRQSNINTLVPRWYFLEQEEPLSDYTDPSLVTWAKQNHKSVWAMVGNHSDRDLTHQVLTDPKRKSAVINGLVSNVKKFGLDGINVDFENVAPGDRQAFTSFIAELAAELHEVKAKLSVDVPPDMDTDWSEAFDYVALGKTADYVVLMGYDEHWNGDPEAGSVSSLPWLKKTTKKLVDSVAPGKTIVALPFYTRDWSLLPGGALSDELILDEQTEVLSAYQATPEWNTALGQYIANYIQDGVQHRIWTEDSRSLSVKYQMAASYGVAGFAYWSIGGESQDIWESLRNIARYSSYRFSK